MLDINIQHYNEMLRYERDMDYLRALSQWTVKSGKGVEIPGYKDPVEYVFNIVGFYSREFAADILEQGQVSPQTTGRMKSGLDTLLSLLGITEKDLDIARDNQLYKNSGFWEMRRFLGPMRGLVEDLKKDRITNIVSVAVSGCVIASYIGLLLERMDYPVAVDHMLLARQGPVPVLGLLSKNVVFGSRILIVDDAIWEARTLPVVVARLRAASQDADLRLFVLDTDPRVDIMKLLPDISTEYKLEE